MVLKTAAWHISRIRRRQFVRREEEEEEEGGEEEEEELIIVVRPPGPGCRCASTVQYTTYSTVHVCVPMHCSHGQRRMDDGWVIFPTVGRRHTSSCHPSLPPLLLQWDDPVTIL